MTIELYNLSCERISRLVTNCYSTSFSLGIRVFPKDIRQTIYSIYGFVRFADEIVDTFHGYDKAALLGELRQDFWTAVERKFSINPIFHAFQQVVNTYHINREHLEAFLTSMEMDLTFKTFSRPQYEQYVYGSAEVIGLMCLRVFCRGDEALFDRLKNFARQLGAAFQKVNFLRDIQSDLEWRGRIYLPDVAHREEINRAAKESIEKEIEAELAQAYEGIRQLPRDVQWGVTTAYFYYQALFARLRQSDISLLLTQRVRVPDFVKFFLLIHAYVTVKFHLYAKTAKKPSS